MFVCYEALKEVQVKEVTVQTPVAEALCQKISEEIVVVPILRAGVGMLEGILDLVPTARVGFLGMYRDEKTAEPVAYYQKLPEQMGDAIHIVIDPMLATGGSTAAAIDLLKASGATKIVVVKRRQVGIGQLPSSGRQLEGQPTRRRRRGSSRSRGNHPARRHLESGQVAVVAQSLAAKIAACRSATRSAFALRQ